jgi:hypothetical protein
MIISQEGVMSLGRIICLSTLLLAACSKTNGEFCEGHADDPRCAPIDGSMKCSSSSECTMPGAMVCDVSGTKTCVECTPGEATACESTEPVCGDDNACRGCTSHAECSSSSNVCLPDGSCAAETEVAYVEAGASGTCDKASPCGTLAAGIAKTRKYVKVTGAVNADTTTVSISQAVTILAAPNASVNVTADDVPVLAVSTSNADVKIYDLEVTGGTMANGIGISMLAGGTPKLTLTRAKVTNNQGIGISAAGGSLTVTQSTISGNDGGGISVAGSTATFAIVGNIVYQNGTQAGLVGGISIATMQNAANRLEFNSLNQNQVQAGFGAAIHCIAGTFTARNNIMSENGTQTNLEQVGGTCAHVYSIARPGTVPGGTGNSPMDPLFVNTLTGNLHLMPGSPAIGAADPSSGLTGFAELDIDNQKRTSPAEMGADEIP